MGSVTVGQTAVEWAWAAVLVLLVGALLVNALVAGATALLELMQTRGARQGAVDRSRDACPPIPSPAPFVSVHVATHDEPPALVIATLEALARLDWPAFEVLVIDNNTPDPAIWKPLEAACERLGTRFRFSHHDQVTGAKAGALNIALARTDPRARFIAIVDADYRVAPDFLRCAVAACAGPRTHFVQFPQTYRASAAAPSVAAELRDYFRVFPTAANATRAPLLTGTLSLIRREALTAQGGWPTGSITEDAQLGLGLWAAGARGRFVDRNVGEGLLPVDLAGLRLQRSRWVAGNVQTLRRGWSLLTGQRRAGRRRLPGRMAVLAQLTAWPAFMAVPGAALLFIALGLAAGLEATKLARIAAGLAAATLGLALLTTLVRAASRGRLATAEVKAALWWSSSLAWWPALWGRRLTFRRTPKATADQAPAARRRLLPGDIDRACSWVCLPVGAVLIASGLGGAGVVAILIGLTGLWAGPRTDAALRRAARVAVAG